MSSRLQHMTASGLVLLVGIWAFYVSFTQEPASAFLFPRLISSFFLALALWTFVKAALGKSKVGEGLDIGLVKRMAPGVVLAAIYVLWAAKTLGFYAASTVAFFLLLSIYDPAPHGSARSWVRRVIVTAVFMAIIYGLFAKILAVYTPRGMFM
ncbi:MAG: tripartite tricarboxylate transporter TctB family protein [Pikeienuella sp.]